MHDPARADLPTIAPEPTVEPLPAPDDVVAAAGSTLGTLRGLLVGAAIGAAVAGVGFGLVDWLGGDRSPSFDVGLSGAAKALFGVALILPLLLVLAVHEVGHALGGRLARFRFSMLVVGPLRVEQRDGRLRFGLNRDLALYGGIAASLPTDDRDLPRRMARMIAGGPLASLAFGVLALALRSALPGGESLFARYLEIELGILGWASVGIALVTLVPLRTAGFHSDGARLLLLRRGGAEAEREAAIWRLVTLSQTGMRPRDWPRDAVAAVLEPRDGGLFEYTGRMLAYSWALDDGAAGAARDHLARGLALWPAVPSPVRADLAAEAAFFEGACRADLERARAWWRQAEGKQGFDVAGRARAEVVLRRLEGDTTAAADGERRLDEALTASPDRGGAEAQRDWVALRPP